MDGSLVVDLGGDLGGDVDLGITRNPGAYLLSHCLTLQRRGQGKATPTTKDKVSQQQTHNVQARTRRSGVLVGGTVMTQELEQLMTARHKAFIEWNSYTAKGESRAGLYETFCSANRAYVQARDNQRQINSATSGKAAA